MLVLACTLAILGLPSLLGPQVAQGAAPVVHGPPTVSSSLTVNRPPGLVVGDLVVALVGSVCISGIPNVTAPAGWTPIENGGVGTVRLATFYRRHAAGDPASYTFTAAGCMLVSHTSGTIRVTGVSASSPIEASDSVVYPSAVSNTPAPALTTSTPRTTVLPIGFITSSATYINPPGHTPVWNNSGFFAGLGAIVLASREQSIPGTVPALPLGITGSAGLGIGMHIAFTPITVPISGRALDADGSPWDGCGATASVSVAVGTTRVDRTTCSTIDGTWTVQSSHDAGEVLTAWLDDDASGRDGVTYGRTVDTTTPITGIDIRQDEVRTPVSMTTAELGTFDTTEETGTVDIPVTAPNANTLTISGTSTFVVGGGTFTHGTGVITAPRMRIASGATFTPGAGHQLVLTGSGTGACSAGTSARPLCVTGSVSGSLAARYEGTADLDVDGTATYAALTLRPTAGTPTYHLGSSDDATITAAALTLDGSSATLIASTSTHSPSVTVAGAVSVAAGATLSGSGTGTISSTSSISGAGRVTLTDGTYVLRSSASTGQAVNPTSTGSAWQFATLRLTTSVAGGSTISTLASTRSLVIGTRLVLGDAGDTGTTIFDVGVPLTISGDFETTAKGMLRAPAAMYLVGDIIHRGNFMPRGGMLVFTGGGTSTMYTYPGSGGTLYDVSVTTPKTLALATDGGMQIDHHLQVQGADCANVARLVSATPGAPQTLHVLGTVTADWASIADIAATGPIIATNSGDLGGNTNITFSGSPCAGPVDLFTGTTSASAGATRPTTIDGRGAFHMSFRNNSLAEVDRYRTGISSSWIAGDTVGLWPLDGSGADRAATAATLTGPGTMPAWTAGGTHFGQAASFDGVNDVLAAPTHVAYDATTFTVEAWIRASSIAHAARPTIVSRTSGATNQQFSIAFDRAAGQLVARTTAGGAATDLTTPAAPWLDDTWHHVAFTADGSKQLRLYVDGVQQATGSYTGTMDMPASPVRIGGTGTTGEYFAGMVDDVQLTTRAMDPAEIAGYVATARPHAQVVWQTANPAGATLATNCDASDRCADTTYGGASLHRPGARWFVAHQTRTIDGLWSNFSVDWFETSDGITVAPIAPVSFAASAPGTDATASTTVTTTCTVSTGCSVQAHGPSQTVALSTLDNGGGSVPHITPASPSAPGAWAAGAQLGLGFTVLQTSSGKSTGTWGVGTDFSDLAQLKFVGVTREPVALVTTTTAGTETTSLGLRLNAPSSAAVGHYAGQFTVVAVGNL